MRLTKLELNKDFAFLNLTMQILRNTVLKEGFAYNNNKLWVNITLKIIALATIGAPNYHNTQCQKYLIKKNTNIHYENHQVMSENNHPLASQAKGWFALTLSLQIKYYKIRKSL